PSPYPTDPSHRRSAQHRQAGGPSARRYERRCTFDCTATPSSPPPAGRRRAGWMVTRGGEAMTRVLMGDFSALHRLGLKDILRVDGIELMESAGAGVLARLRGAVPNLIVLDLDKRATSALVHVNVHRYPAVKVVACS